MILNYIINRKELIVSIAVLTGVAILALVSVARLEVLKIDVETFRSEAAFLSNRTVDHGDITKRNEQLVANNDELRSRFVELYADNIRLSAANKELKSLNSELTSANAELTSSNDELLETVEWLEEAILRPQPEEIFRITFYSSSGSYSHLIPNETVAMNSQQVADLGLKRGDEIFVRSNRGWSGFYKITDSGCAYGTIDIYIDYKDLPSWGAENGAMIFI